MAEARLFIATLPSLAFLDGLERFRGALSGAYQGLRIIPRANLHVTLKFLGSVDEARVAEICVRVARVVESAERSTLLFDELIALPRASKARVIALSATPPRALCALVAQLERCMAELGVAPETRPFFAHLTLGRAKARARLIGERAPTPPRLALDVDEIILMQSQLGPQGPVYQPRARWTIPPP